MDNRYPDRYLEDFKKDYESYGKYNLKRQVPHLHRLADYYYDKYLKNGQWTDCLKAHSLYNSIATRDPHDRHWHEKAFETQQIYWRGATNITITDQKHLTESLHGELEMVRQKTRGELEVSMTIAKELREDFTYNKKTIDEFSNSVRSTSVSCTDGMMDIAKGVILESMKMMTGEPPCPFTAVAIGSLARGEATPYSDLEYLFLLEKKTPEVVQYFEKLAVTTYFVMGNLGETKLSYMSIGELKGADKWFDDQAKNGFKIDGLSPSAGNIPTGNGEPTKKNHFIMTPCEMVSKYTAILKNPIKDDALRGDFTAMLAYTKSIYSHQSGESPDLLQKVKEEIASVIPNGLRERVNMEMLKADMTKFHFKPTADLRYEGYTIDVKTELYRFPSILLYDLSIIYGCIGDSVWETVEILHCRGHISAFIRTSLLFQLSVACYVRLSTYLYHDSHDDRVSLALSLQDTSLVKAQRKRWPMPGNLLFTVCGFMIPLKQNLLANPDATLSMMLDGNDGCSNIGWLPKAQALYFCGRWFEAFEVLDATGHLETPERFVNEIFAQKFGAEECGIFDTIYDIVEAADRQELSKKLMAARKTKHASHKMPISYLLKDSEIIKNIRKEDTDFESAFQILKGGEPFISDGIQSLAENANILADQMVNEVDVTHLTDDDLAAFDSLEQFVDQRFQFREKIEQGASFDDVIRHVWSDMMSSPESLQSVFEPLVEYFKSADVASCLHRLGFGDQSMELGEMLRPTALLQVLSTNMLSNSSPEEKCNAHEQLYIQLLEVTINFPGAITPHDWQVQILAGFLPMMSIKEMSQGKLLKLGKMTASERLLHVQHDEKHKSASIVKSGILMKLGQIYAEREDHELAQAYYDKAYELDLDVNGEGAVVSGKQGSFHGLSAINAQKMGKVDKARKHLREFKIIVELLMGLEHKYVGKISQVEELLENGEDIDFKILEDDGTNQERLMHDEPE